MCTTPAGPIAEIRGVGVRWGSALLKNAWGTPCPELIGPRGMEQYPVPAATWRPHDTQVATSKKKDSEAFAAKSLISFLNFGGP